MTRWSGQALNHLPDRGEGKKDRDSAAALQNDNDAFFVSVDLSAFRQS